jgi:hypothetical protein
MSTSKVTKVTMAQRVRDLVAGTLKNSPNGSLTFGGQTFTAQSLIQVLQDLENAISKVDTAKASWNDALKSLADEKAKADPIVGAYRSWLLATYGNAPAILAEYGMTPRKAPTPLTAEQMALAVAKRAATRAARHTAGPKQKAAIKGDVKVSVVTTPASPPPAKAT